MTLSLSTLSPSPSSATLTLSLSTLSSLRTHSLSSPFVPCGPSPSAPLTHLPTHMLHLPHLPPSLQAASYVEGQMQPLGPLLSHLSTFLQQPDDSKLTALLFDLAHRKSFAAKEGRNRAGG